MAKKRRRRSAKQVAAFKRMIAANPRRRRARVRANPKRRRRVAVRHAILAVNPTRRRRRSVMRSNPKRRRHRFHRNPVSVRGITGILSQGVQDGAAVYAGGLAARKVTALVNNIGLGTSTATLTPGVMTILPRLGTGIVLGMFAPKFAPKYARMLTAGAMSETIAAVLALTPVAPYLGAGPVRRFTRTNGRTQGVRGWPGTGAPRGAVTAGMGAYPAVIRMPQSVGN
jgi:hypothetical protein